MLAALLLGPAAAIGVAARVPGLITGARDGFVVAAYLGCCLAPAAACAFAISLGASSLVARTALQRSAGAGSRWRPAPPFTIACLAYLTLWWDASTFGEQAAPLRSVWTLVPLAFAAAISVLLGHLVTVTTLAVVVSRTGGVEPAAASPDLRAS